MVFVAVRKLSKNYSKEPTKPYHEYSGLYRPARTLLTPLSAQRHPLELVHAASALMTIRLFKMFLDGSDECILAALRTIEERKTNKVVATNLASPKTFVLGE